MSHLHPPKWCGCPGPSCRLDGSCQCIRDKFPSPAAVTSDQCPALPCHALPRPALAASCLVLGRLVGLHTSLIVDRALPICLRYLSGCPPCRHGLFCFPVYYRLTRERESPVPPPATRGSLCLGLHAGQSRRRGEEEREREGKKRHTVHWAACSINNCAPPPSYIPQALPPLLWLVIAATVTLPATQGSGEGLKLGPTWCDLTHRRKVCPSLSL